MNIVTLLLKAFLLVTPTFAVNADSINFVQVATLPPSCYNIVFGDTDHDSLYEVISYYKSSGEFRLHIHEHKGDNCYDTVSTAFPCIPWAIGDPDKDGLTDILCTRGGDTICLVESVHPDSYPSKIVWEVKGTEAASPGCGRIADLDKDGKMEVLFSGLSGEGPVYPIYENIGDNMYQCIDTLVIGHYASWAGDPGIGDFDNDGLTEIAIGDDWGQVHFFECIEDDSFELVCVTPEMIDQTLAYDICTTNDMDQDGKLELIVGGSNYLSAWHFRVFETTGNNSYEVIWDNDEFTGGWFGNVAAGDVDGDGIDEFALSTGAGVRIFKCVGPDSFLLIWYYPTNIENVYIYDINQNGFAEVIISDHAHPTRIFEIEDGGIEEEKRVSSPTTLYLYPNPFMGYLNIHGVKCEVEIYDLSGRLIGKTDNGIWNGRDSAGKEVQSGIYFLRAKGYQPVKVVKLK